MSKSVLKKALSGLIVGLLTIGLLAGCGGIRKQNANEIRIGANFGLTGGIATYGNSSKNAVEMAIKEINANGGILGKQLVVVFADNRNEAAESAAAATKLITRDKVVAVLGPIASSNVLAASQIHMDNKVPLLTATATSPKVTVDEAGKVKDYIFRACFTDSFQGTVMANFTTKSLRAKTAAIMVDNSSDYSKGLTQVFKDSFVKAGGTIIAEEAFQKKDQDFRATLTKIKARNPDVIFIPAYYEEAGKIVKQARELGFNGTMLGTDGWDSPKMVEIAGAVALNGTYFSNHYSPDDTSASVQKFVEAYKAAYGQTPDALAALAYDAAYMLADAIKRAGSAEPAKIKEALASTKDLQVVTGTLNLDEQHNSVKSAVIIEYKDGRQEFKETVNP